MKKYHTPVLLHQSIDGLNILPNGIYVDCTYGGGGHSAEILQHLEKGKLIAFDQDADAFANKISDERLLLIQGNFRFMQNYLQYEGIDKVDGILADLGVSGHHFDTQERGFSFRFRDADLDMRMNKKANLTAKKVLNEYSTEELIYIFKTYGEINNSQKLVSLIENKRKQKNIENIEDFIDSIEIIVPKKLQAKYLAKVFQAIRIEVNKEIEALKQMLIQAEWILKKGGRLSVITYHSLEDRLVKNFIKTSNFEGSLEKDFFGNVNTSFLAINRKVIVPTEQEIKENNRARSAKLRIAEKK